MLRVRRHKNKNQLSAPERAIDWEDSETTDGQSHVAIGSIGSSAKPKCAGALGALSASHYPGLRRVISQAPCPVRTSSHRTDDHEKVFL